MGALDGRGTSQRALKICLSKTKAETAEKGPKEDAQNACTRMLDPVRGMGLGGEGLMGSQR